MMESFLTRVESNGVRESEILGNLFWVGYAKILRFSEESGFSKELGFGKGLVTRINNSLKPTPSTISKSRRSRRSFEQFLLL